MEAVTYRDPSVIQTINENVIPVQVKTKDPDEAARAVMRRYLQVWTPTILLISPDGSVYHEWSGYLPPDLYAAHLLLGRGKAALKEERFDVARQLFDEVSNLHPLSDVAPEALYWAAVASYKGSGN
ncbi:MAG TPA: hypothetical protein VGR16_11605, partial [Thermomicrobiales bacterium]|nr:hypothetical protein [Thermomicrobiales bacterium]